MPLYWVAEPGPVSLCTRLGRIAEATDIVMTTTLPGQLLALLAFISVMSFILFSCYAGLRDLSRRVAAWCYKDAF